MNFKDSFSFILLSFFILLTYLLFFISRPAIWSEDGPFMIVLIFICIATPMFLVTILSLFSPRNENEKKLRIVFKETPFISKVLVWIVLFLLSLIVVLGDFVPFPAVFFYLFFTFSWIYSLVGILSQKLVIEYLSSIINEEGKGTFNSFNRYLNSLMFGYVFVMFLRISSLPGYVRKPVGVVIFLGFILSFFISPTVF